MTEQELRQIEAAIRNTVTDTLQRGRLSERLARERAAAQELMRGGCTPMLAARKLANDPHDPDEIERLAQRFRDHLRRAKKNAESA
jgi:hypothetical protein